MTDSLQVIDKMRVSASTDPNTILTEIVVPLVREGSSNLFQAGSCNESGFPSNRSAWETN